MVPQLQHKSLISGGKFADANYITVLTPTEVLIYDDTDIYISVSKGPILQGCRDTTTGLWRIPLQPIVPPLKSEFTSHNKAREDAIANFYKLTSSDKTIRYINACTGFLTNRYWLKASKGGNYATSHNQTAEAVKQHFP